MCKIPLLSSARSAYTSVRTCPTTKWGRAAFGRRLTLFAVPFAKRAGRGGMGSEIIVARVCAGRILSLAKRRKTRALRQKRSLSKGLGFPRRKRGRRLLRINLGCSNTRMLRGDWVGVDIRSDVQADIVADLTHANPFEPNSAKEIYCSHTLEHFALGYAYQLLERMSSWLVRGGLLWVAVPDFPTLAAYYIHGIYSTELYELIHGHGTHLSQWTRGHLAAVLDHVGFDILADDFAPRALEMDSEQPDSSRRCSIRFKCRRNRPSRKAPYKTMTPTSIEYLRADVFATRDMLRHLEKYQCTE